MPQNQDDTLLLFRIDRIPCAVPAASVLSIVMPPQHFTQLPGSNQGRPGIFRYNEHVFSVIDLHQRFGITAPRQGSGRLLLHENGIRRHALWVDQVIGLARSDEGKWATLPPMLPKSLFHSGFLYQDEIVLCSTLDALLAMNDAAPIQQYLAHLQSTEEKTSTGKVSNAEEKAAQPESSSPATTTTSSQESVTPEREPTKKTERVDPIATHHKTTPSPAVKAKERTESTIKKPTQPSPRPVQKPARHKPRPVTPGKTGEIAKPRPAYDTPAPEQPFSSEVSPPPLSAENSTSSWLPLGLVVLLLTAAVAVTLWQLLPSRQHESAPITATTIEPPTDTAVIEEPPRDSSPQPVPPEIGEETVTEAPTVTVPDSPEIEEEPVIEAAFEAPHEQVQEELGVIDTPAVTVGRDEAAIQIERDEEGTIKLIIQRDRLMQLSEAPPAEPAPAEPDEAADEEILTSNDSTVLEPQPASTDTSGYEETDESAPPAADNDEEEPLSPDSDWPRPQSLPEPCDCTHIVVKGDTLWDIAQKYTNNAFNYPELARQSGIRNPHRIYPGNKVRIIVR